MKFTPYIRHLSKSDPSANLGIAKVILEAEEDDLVAFIGRILKVVPEKFQVRRLGMSTFATFHRFSEFNLEGSGPSFS